MKKEYAIFKFDPIMLAMVAHGFETEEDAVKDLEAIPDEKDDDFDFNEVGRFVILPYFVKG